MIASDFLYSNRPDYPAVSAPLQASPVGSGRPIKVEVRVGYVKNCQDLSKTDVSRYVNILYDLMYPWDWQKILHITTKFSKIINLTFRK